MNKVVKIVLGLGGFVFGGYVRDLIANETPRDIDCHISTFKIMEFLRQLVEDFDEVTIVKMEKYGEEYYTNDFLRLIVSDGDNKIQVDVTGAPLASPDFDVNMLKMDYAGISLMASMLFREPLSVESILSNISRRRAVPLPTVTRRRIRKMEQKGWSVSFPEPSVIRY